MQSTTTTPTPTAPAGKPDVVVIHNQPHQSRHHRGPVVASLLFALVFLAGATYYFRTNTVGDAPVNSLAPARVLITADGFSPSTIKLKKGQQVTWINSDAQPRMLVANSSKLLALNNTTLLNTDESQTITVETAGTFQYHDATSTTNFSGTIIVE